MIALLSPKGGVGRSTAAALLAAAYAARGQRVLLCDLDPTVHTVDLFFGVEDRALFGLYDLLAGKDAARALLPVGEGEGISLLSGGGAGELAAEDDLARVLTELTAQGAYDRVILDLPAYAFQRNCYRSLVHTFLIVSTPEPAALLGAQSASQQVGEEGEAYLLLNRLVKGEPVPCGMRPYEMIDLVQRPLIGILPEDADLAFTLSKGQLGGFKGELLLAAENIASRLEGEEVLLFEGLKDGKKHRRGL